MFKKSISDLVAGDMYRILNSEEHARLFKKAYRSEDDDNDAKTCKTCKHDKDMCMCGDMNNAKDEHPFHKSRSCKECGKDKDKCMCGDMSYVSDEDMSWAEDDNFAAPMAPAAKPMTPPPAAPKPAAPAPAAAPKKAWHNGRGYRKYADDNAEGDYDHKFEQEIEEERAAEMYMGKINAVPNIGSRVQGYFRFLNAYVQIREGKPVTQITLDEVNSILHSPEVDSALKPAENFALYRYFEKGFALGKNPYPSVDKKASIATYSALEDLITASAALDYADLSKASELALKLASLVSQAKKEKMSGKSISSTSKKSTKKPAKKPMKGKKPASSASSKSTSSSSSKSTSSSSSKSSKKMTMKEKMEMLRSKRK